MITGTATHTSEVLEGIRTWVEIESQSADTDGVNRMVSKVAADFSSSGARVNRIRGRDGYGDHLSIRSSWGADGPGILVLCHIDTVHPRGTLAAHLPFRVDGDRAFGPGIYDMKGGAYLAFAAFRALARSGKTTPLPIEFVITSDEEVGSPTSRVLIEQAAARAKYVLVTEPARDGGKIVTARKGVARYVLTAHGRPAHAGARHEEGRSAILELARQVVHLEAMTDYDRGLTLNVGQIGGGTADNVVPQLAWANIDIRIATMADAEAVHRKLKSLKPYNRDVRLELSGGLNRPPYEQNSGVMRLYDHARRVAREIDIELVGVKTGGGSDGNFTAHLVPTLDGLGVDGNGAHTLNEHLLISSIAPRMTLMRRLFETLH
jgi:glutamate carboxypeptidase